MKRTNRAGIVILVLLALQYVSLFFVYGEDIDVIPLLGLAAATAGAAFRQTSGRGTREFAVFALIWWLVTILLTGDTYAAWGSRLLSGLLGGGVLLGLAFLLQVLAKKYWKRHEQEGVFFFGDRLHPARSSGLLFRDCRRHSGIFHRTACGSDRRKYPA